MSNTNVQPESNKALDIGVVTLAVLIVAAGIFAFTFLTDQQLGIRIGALVGGLVIGCGVAAFSPSGKRFIGFCRESYDELRRVAFYLFVVDKFVEWGLYDGLLRLSF